MSMAKITTGKIAEFLRKRAGLVLTDAEESRFESEIQAAINIEIENNDAMHCVIDRAQAEELKRLRDALRRIAGVEQGMGIHRPCCAQSQTIAKLALGLTETIDDAAKKQFGGWEA